MKTTSVSLLVIRTRDMKTALTFYSALGLDFAEEQHGTGPFHLACELDNFVFEIYPARPTDGADSTMLGFAVESLDETLATLQRLGVEPKSPPKTADWGRFTNVVDFDGRVVQLTEI